MDTTPDWMEPLRKFAEAAQPSTTFLSLDLDGTALLEDHGKVFISSSVEKGVKALYDLKVPILINTLRFPLSVLNTVGQARCQIANNPIPTVLLNGSVLGYVRCDHGELSYEEIAAYPLGTDEIQAMLGGITQLSKSGIDDLLLFFYARDWRDGETLWTPCPEKLLALKKKYVSASRVFSCRPDELASELLQREICMTSLFIDRPEDTLMAYQHSKRNSFFTARGVDKSSGLRALAARFSLDPG